MTYEYKPTLAYDALRASVGTSAEAFWGMGDQKGGIIDEVWAERKCQLKKWGEQSLPSGNDPDQWGYAEQQAKLNCEYGAKLGNLAWVDVLGEEVAEAFASSDVESLRAELIQVMAVAAAWVEDLDRKPEPEAA